MDQHTVEIGDLSPLHPPPQAPAPISTNSTTNTSINMENTSYGLARYAQSTSISQSQPQSRCSTCTNEGDMSHHGACRVSTISALDLSVHGPRPSQAQGTSNASNNSSWAHKFKTFMGHFGRGFMTLSKKQIVLFITLFLFLIGCMFLSIYSSIFTGEVTVWIPEQCYTVSKDIVNVESPDLGPNTAYSVQITVKNYSHPGFTKPFEDEEVVAYYGTPSSSMFRTIGQAREILDTVPLDAWIACWVNPTNSYRVSIIQVETPTYPNAETGFIVGLAFSVLIALCILSYYIYHVYVTLYAPRVGVTDARYRFQAHGRPSDAQILATSQGTPQANALRDADKIKRAKVYQGACKLVEILQTEYAMTSEQLTHSSNADECCSICLESLLGFETELEGEDGDIEQGEKEKQPRLMIQTHCGHWFHMECLRKWIFTRYTDKCPLCQSCIVKPR